MTAIDQFASPLILRRAWAPPAHTVLSPPPAASDRPFEELRRAAPELGVSGVHPNTVVALVALYAALLLSFWLFFGTLETALTLGVITVFGILYFGLMAGGVLVADSAPRSVRGRSFGDFLEGRVLVATGWIAGREALAQILVLPAALVLGGTTFGLIWRLTAG
ncbi:MAG TPA: hypothetical protein VNW53_05280 [Phenylobacterium sp.]|jgi:hypothetical protein|uniref:hypothetical protein n=1 Tax=Phenylobacterium sp. TaxID=1871053 RepID=UPI002B7A9CB1|nr:hypothetical protein [Phenylobacterium sp.]HXA38394.1 hypothetical protein [Phenylobacterium sp.]